MINHQQVIELLPWYVNATLEPDERGQVEAHLKECRECSLEFEQALELSMAVAQSEVPEPSPFQFTRAMARVEEYEREKARAPWWQAVPRFARLAMAAQLILILALGVLLLRRESGFTTASDPSAGPRIVLGFQDGVTEQAARQVVQEIHGEIVAGPSALGLYTVRVPGEDIEKLVEKLQRNTIVIRVAALVP